MRVASLPEERWAMKAAGWNPELSTKYRTYRAVGRPKKRWEDEINDFFRQERTEDEMSNVERFDEEWITTAKDQEGWKKMENKFAMTAAAAPGTRQCSKNSERCLREVRREVDGTHFHAGLRVLLDVEAPKQ